VELVLLYPNSSIANRETHQNQSSLYRVSDDDFAGFFFRVFLVFKNSGERIGEDRQRFLEIYAYSCSVKVPQRSQRNERSHWE
jgi:hypothetical protein